MNAYLMSAGCATRLRPMTERYPKCLLKISQKPMIEHWLNAVFGCEQFNNVFVNVHHCSEKVIAWVKNYCKYRQVNVQIIDETAGLLGTAGTLYWHGDPTEDFMVAYTDTFSEKFFKNIKDYIGMWKNNPDKPLASLFSFDLPEDKSAGSMEVDYIGNITKFSEKNEDGLVAWAGIMFCRGNFIDEVGMNDKDISRDVFPRLAEKMSVMAHIDAYDIGRGVEEYEHFNRKNG